MSYKIELTDDEFRAIQFTVDRGYFPEETYLGMSEHETTPGVFRGGDGQ